MINVSVEADIRKAMELLNLLPQEANRAAYRAMNKIADEIKKDSIARIVGYTGLDAVRVKDRFYIKGASANRLMAVVGAMPSARNVGYEKGANVRPKPAISGSAGGGVSLRAWGKPAFYDRAFVKGKQGNVNVRRTVWRRTGPKKEDITSQTWGPSVPRTFEKPWMMKHNLELLRQRWPFHFERYLRAEIVRLKGRDALTGVKNVAPFITGAVVTE
jgi:hypothetical protein